jgi:hypothetical protein
MPPVAVFYHECFEWSQDNAEIDAVAPEGLVELHPSFRGRVKETVPCGVLQSTMCVRPKFQMVIVEELIMQSQDCVIILCKDPNQDQVVFGEHSTTVDHLYNITTTVPPTYILQQSIKQSVQSPW